MLLGRSHYEVLNSLTVQKYGITILILKADWYNLP